MRTFRCECENVLFFDNSSCLRCGKETGYCPVCRSVVALLPGEESLICGNPGCGSALVKCSNYADHNVCNRCIPREGPGSESTLCSCCQFNDTIPDLSVAGNREKWYRLEAAKRRLFYDLDLLGLPYVPTDKTGPSRLRFAFKGDVQQSNEHWRPMGKERVFTGHDNGLITINIQEADDVERERLRLSFGEAHRTLIGHFRHEIAHYYWDVLVKGKLEKECIEVFGDHENPSYTDALAAYYKNGAPTDWGLRYVSAYATMHPWEDFAETFATYLDMVSVLDTAHHFRFVRTVPRFGDLEAMVRQYQWLGVAMNEVNRSVGLLDLVPDMLIAPVQAKMRFIHDVVRAASRH